MPSFGEELSTDIKGASVFSYPLFPYLFVAICSFALSASFPQFANFKSLALIFSIGAYLANFSLLLICGGSFAKRLAFSLRLIATFLLCIFYFCFRVAENPYPHLTPRAVELILRVEEVSRGENGNVFGTGRIENSPKTLPRLQGALVWFSAFANTSEDYREISVSEQIQISGILERSDAHLNANFNAKSKDFNTYLKRRMIYFKLSAALSNVAKLQPPSAFYRFIDKTRNYMLSSLEKLPFGFKSESESARTYRAMMLGENSLLTKEQKREFQETGTMHIFAVSGLHVGFAAAFLFAVLSLARVNWRVQLFVALPILFLYVFACGAKPSAMRSFMMIAIVWGALSFGRGTKALGALMLAAAIALAINPLELFDVGFTLSYAIVASIFTYGLPLYKNLSSKFLPLRAECFGFVSSKFRAMADWLLCAFCISLGAMLASFPLGAYYFSSLSPTAVLYSPIFVVLSGLVVGLGFAGFFLPAIIAAWLNLVAVGLVWCMNFCASASVENMLAPTIAFSMPSGFFMAFALFAFLLIPEIFVRGAFILRFCLAPMLMFLIMVISHYV